MDIVVIQHQLEYVVMYVIMMMPQYVVLQVRHIKIDVI